MCIRDRTEIAAPDGDAYKFLFMTKGGGSANKSLLFQETKALLNPTTFAKWIDEKIRTLGTAACPPYHLGVVVDDTEMEITHAIRGDEWIPSAPKHIQLYAALGWEPPVWAHLPLILGPDHKKLSKRSGDTALLDYRTNGYLPEAMINFLAFLGWSLDDHTAILSIDEFKQNFDLARVVANPAVFDIDRLNYLNGHYIREMDDHRWRRTIAECCEKDLPDSVKRPVEPAVIESVAPLLKERTAKLADIAPMVVL